MAPHPGDDDFMKTDAAGATGANPGRGPNRRLIGLDLGGTKCAVSVWREDRVEEVARFGTGGWDEAYCRFCDAVAPLAEGAEVVFGVSCGGPLDAAAGVILNPPNLPVSWHGVPIVRRLTERFGGRAFLMNDANACALAEWRFGAGRGAHHLIFLTCGTGMGAGLILNGRLYEGATGDAGEIGHVRLRADGPIGYGKAGSVEGWTSGGGIARLAKMRLARAERPPPSWCPPGVTLTTRLLADAARQGDPLSRDILAEAGAALGETLALLIDVFNPERIVIGGLYPRCEDLLGPAMRAALEREALPGPRAACAIVPAALGETIGSHGAIAAALHGLTTPEAGDRAWSP